MSKILEVIEPFFTLSIGDTLELTSDGKNYVHSCNNEFCKAGKNGEDCTSSFASTVTFSVAYAKELINEGYLQEVTATTSKDFVNVFTEIDTLLDKYNEEIRTLDSTMRGVPQCVKLERATVLSNLITLLTHLKSLKK